MRVIQSKFTTTNPNFFQNGGGGRAPGAPVLDPPLIGVKNLRFHCTICSLDHPDLSSLDTTTIRW